MATFSTSTCLRVNEDASCVTPIFLEFKLLLHAFSHAIAAERDADGANGWDPATDTWLREADEAWDAVRNSIARILPTPAADAADGPLKRLAFVLHTALRCESDTQLDRVLGYAEANAAHFFWPGNDPLARRINAMTRAGLWFLANLGDPCMEPHSAADGADLALTA